MLRHLLSGLVFAALLAFVLALTLQDASAAEWRHVLFAMGVLPLILGAMLYFVPVLSRTAPARGGVLLAPVAALISGIAVVLLFRWSPAFVPVAAGLVLALVVVEMVWIWQRRRQVFGTPHPGLDWYLTALALLAVALGLIVSRIPWPAGWAVTRLLHLHLNLLGFLGLTAVSTLRVLLPTVLGVQDTATMPFLRRQLPIACAGTLAIALGAAFLWPLALLGGVLWLWPAVSLLRVAWRHRSAWWRMQGAGILLIAAAFGWALVMIAGIAHAYAWLSADTLLAWLLYLFLLPLVTGATSHLLPVWRWPGRQSAEHVQMRERLTAFAGSRVLMFWLSAVLVAADTAIAPLPAGLALMTYLVQIFAAFARVRPSSAA